MIKKSDIVKKAVQKKEWKKALQIAKDFHIGVTQEERDKMARAYECIVHPDFYRQIGTDIPKAIEQGKEIVKKYAESRRKNSMKWDVKHDRAKRVIDAFLENAAYWEEREDLSADLTEEEKEQVSSEVNLMIESIRKRYKLQERLTEQRAETKQESPAEEVKEEATEETTAGPEKEEKPKRGRKPAGEKKAPSREPRAKKAGKEAQD